MAELKSVSKLHLSPSPSATKEHTLFLSDWSLLPEDLLHFISENLENFVDVVHARSVCSSWRSTLPFPGSLLRPSYSIPRFNEVSLETQGFCTLEKIPLFLVRVCTLHAVSTSEYILGGIGRRDESEDHMMELPSPLQCSVKVKIGESDPILMNMLDCQILPLGHQYRMIGCDPKSYMGMALLPLDKEGGRGFVLLLNDKGVLWVLTSSGEMKWKRLENVPKEACWDLVTFRGKFYAAFLNRTTMVIDPYSLDLTLLMKPSQHPELLVFRFLVPCGNDELFLVERISTSSTYRVRRLDEEAGKLVVVNHLGGRVLFINRYLQNVSCSAKELPDGCGLSGDSIVFTDELGRETVFYKHGVEDDLSFWRSPRDTGVIIISRSPSAVHFRVEQNLTLDT